MTTVTRIDEYHSRDTVTILRDLLARAEAGRLRGLAFSFKSGPHRHRYGLTGDYMHNPTEALGVVTRMEYKVNQLISDMDSEVHTSTMPL